MARILRGEFYWADLDPVRGHEQAGIRPVLVISNDVFNRRAGIVIGMAVTSKQPREPFPLTFPVPHGALPKPSWILISQLRTISVERFGRRIGLMDEQDLATVIDGLNELVS